MADTNNSTVEETVVDQEPIGLEDTAEATDESGAVEEEPLGVSETVEAEEPKGTTDTKEVKGKEKGVDLIRVLEKKLTPKELEAFKKTQADFTKSSQKLSELEKAVLERDDYLKSLQADPEINAIFKARAEKKAKEAEPDFSKMSDEDIFNYTVDKRVQSKLVELESKMDSKYGTYIQSKLVDEGNKIIADFADAKSMEVDEVRQMAKYAVDHRLSLDESYRIFNYDKLPQQAKQEALADLDLKKLANLETGNVPTGVAPIIPDKPTFLEAAQAAAKSTGINWDKVKTD